MLCARDSSKTILVAPLQMQFRTSALLAVRVRVLLCGCGACLRCLDGFGCSVNSSSSSCLSNDASLSLLLFLLDCGRSEDSTSAIAASDAAVAAIKILTPERILGLRSAPACIAGERCASTTCAFKSACLSSCLLCACCLSFLRCACFNFSSAAFVLLVAMHFCVCSGRAPIPTHLAQNHASQYKQPSHGKSSFSSFACCQAPYQFPHRWHAQSCSCSSYDVTGQPVSESEFEKKVQQNRDSLAQHRKRAEIITSDGSKERKKNPKKQWRRFPRHNSSSRSRQGRRSWRR